MAGLYAFRRMRRREPAKLKVLAEDLPRAAWIDRLSTGEFLAVTIVMCLTATAAVFGALDPTVGQEVDRAIRNVKEFAAEWYQGLHPDPKMAEAVRRSAESVRVAKARSAGCHPNYGECLPVVSDVDCIGGNGNAPAFTGRVAVLGADVYHLDGDDDGIGCE